MGEKTVIFINSCIKFAALCGISGPAAFEPAHFFVSFLCASKEMKDTFTMLFVKAKSCEQRNEKYFSLLFIKQKYFALLFLKAKNKSLSIRKAFILSVEV